MTRRNQAHIYAWLAGLLTAFYDGLLSVGVMDVLGPVAGVELPGVPWEKLKTLAMVALLVGFVSMARKLQQSPLPQIEFGEDNGNETQTTGPGAEADQG